MVTEAASRKKATAIQNWGMPSSTFTLESTGGAPRCLAPDPKIENSVPTSKYTAPIPATTVRRLVYRAAASASNEPITKSMLGPTS